MAEPVLSVRDLSIGLKSGATTRPIVSHVSFDLGEHSVLGIIGESGAGKTVLSKAIVNWVTSPLAITGGQVLFNGRNLLDLPGREMQRIRGRDIGYVGANPGSALDPTVTVGAQIVEKLLEVRPGTDRSAAAKRVVDLLDAVRIPSAAQRFNEYPFQFSGGMMQRVLIVDALISNPSFLVADNITQPLDVTVGAQILRLLKELQSEFNTSIIFISSSIATVQGIADTVIVLERGRIIERQETDALIHAPATAYAKRLLEQVPRIWATGGSLRIPAQAATDDAVLEVENVAKFYSVKDRNHLFSKRTVKAVRGVSFSVYRGENFGIVGESGCGKSTLSRLLSRLEQPDTGSIRLNGRDIAHLSARDLLDLRKRFQLLLQDPFNAIPPHFPIGRTIGETLRIHGGMTRSEIRARVEDVMDEVGLPRSLFHELPIGLSAGQRQRVNIARALVVEPELLILDETLSSLDPIEQGKLLDLFERLQKKRAITYIYISHDLAMVRRVCTRVAVMYLGRIVELAGNEALFFEPAHPYTRALLSAAPVIEERRYAASEYLLEGEPPDPIEIPAGCSFRTRCPFAIARCATDEPPLYSSGDGNLSACHLVAGMPDAVPRRFERTAAVVGA